MHAAPVKIVATRCSAAGARGTMKAASCSAYSSHAVLKIRHASRPFATTSTTPPLTLSSPLQKDSPIHFSTPFLPNDPLLDHSSPAPFLFYPAFLSSDEQAVLLRASLEKLDTSLSQSRDVRKRRKEWRKANSNIALIPAGFLPDGLYDFEEVCFVRFSHDIAHLA